MFAGDPARPPATQSMLERLRLTEAFERVTPDVFDQIVDGLKNLRIVLLPIKVIVPRLLGPQQPHLSVGPMSSCSVSLPASASSIDCRRRAAFAGLRTKCSVSIRPSYSSSDIITTVRAFCRVMCSGVRLSHTSSM